MTWHVDRYRGLSCGGLMGGTNAVFNVLVYITGWDFLLGEKLPTFQLTFFDAIS